MGCPRQSEQDAKSSDIEQEHQRRYRERAQKRHEKTYRPGIIHRTSNPTARALPDGRMLLLPGRQEGEVVDEPLHFAFTGPGKKREEPPVVRREDQGRGMVLGQAPPEAVPQSQTDQ